MSVIDLWQAPSTLPDDVRAGSVPARHPDAAVPDRRRLGEATRARGLWKVEPVTDRDTFEALGPEWRHLLRHSPSDCFFLTWEWLFTWWEHLAGNRELSLLAVRNGDGLVGLAPLARGCSLPVDGPGRRLLPTSFQLLGTGQAGSDYLDLIVREGHERCVTKALARHLDRAGAPVELRQVPESGSLARPLAQLLEARGWRTVERRTGVCPVADLAGKTWEEYLAGLSSSHRQNFRRRVRKLEKDFDVRLHQARTPVEVDAAYDILLRLHHDRWEDRGGSDALSESAVVGFHRELLQRATRRGWLRLYVLYLDDRPAAALYGFLYGDRFLFYQSGFDSDFGKYSLGLVIMGLTIREALVEGAREYDLLHGDERYKFHWAGRTRKLARLELYPPSVTGTVLRTLRGAVRGAKDRIRDWREDHDDENGGRA